MALRVGTLAYACASGLGNLVRSFHRAGVVTDVMVVRHGRHETYDDWYPGAPQMTDLKNPAQQRMARQFVESLDVFLAFETPFIWPLIPHCRDRGVKTAIQVQYECMPEKLPYVPDLYLCPSELDARYYPDNSVFIPVPVEVPWRQRTRAEVFVANLGHGGMKGRNGAAELAQAIPLVKSPAKFAIRSQEDRGAWRAVDGDPRVALHFGTVPYEELFAAGDVFVHPTKFDALSLPLQEARAAGMLCMTGDRFPMNQWIPSDGLIPVRRYTRERIGPPYNPIDVAHYDPKDIAATIDRWHGRDITEYSASGKAWAETMSWANLKPRYTEVLESLCAS
jgi:glycosyltransferase involved in cell wall biosynthesis